MSERIAGPQPWKWAVGVQGLVLIALATSGFAVDPWRLSRQPVLFFELNPVHSTVLLAVGLLALLAAQWRPTVLAFSVLEVAGFAGLTLYGMAELASPDPHGTVLALDAADNVLHAAFAVLGVGVLCGMLLLPRWVGRGDSLSRRRWNYTT